MSKTFEQTVEFAAAPEVLYEIFMDSERHAAAINAPASISRVEGGKFECFGGGLTGTNLRLVPGRMIVQSWRANEWKDSDPDSILILQFGKSANGGRIHLIHANIPDHSYEMINEGWGAHYWEPWKAYLAAQKPMKHAASH